MSWLPRRLLDYMLDFVAEKVGAILGQDLVQLA